MHDPKGRGRERSNASDGPSVRDVSRPTATVRIVGRDRWPLALTMLIVAFLGGALLKPWVGEALAPPPPVAAPASESIAVLPSIGPDLLIGLREHCQEPRGWRVYSREMWLGRPVRTWRSIEPAASAVGPDDSAVPTVPLGPFVDALGYCSPWIGDERPPADVRITAWQRQAPGAGKDTWVIAALRPIAPAEPTVLGALFGPIDGELASPQPAIGWPQGRYVFALRAPGWERWWAVDVAVPDVAASSSSAAPATLPVSP